MGTCARDLGGLGHARFRRALDARDPFGASTAALELPHVSLTDALELTLIYLDVEPVRYERAALRWHQRFTQDARLSRRLARRPEPYRRT
jgi:hypothetical protein